MLLRLPADVLAPLRAALSKAGRREIGGQLFGEQLAASDFRITDIAIQRRRGSIARFVVDLVQAGRDAMSFHERTNHEFRRFNYIGEWHSHPSFAVHPSAPDHETMVAMTTDPSFPGTFAVLMIARLESESLRLGAWAYSLDGLRCDVILEIEA
jgi:hypothetical protein